MKMYYFSKGGYNTEYHVMAKSKDAALEFFKKHKQKSLDKYDEKTHEYYEHLSDIEFFTENIDCIEEYGEGEFVETEVC